MELKVIPYDFTVCKLKNDADIDVTKSFYFVGKTDEEIKHELKNVLIHMEKALHSGGIIYSSFKYGDFSGMRNGRFFTDFTKDSA